MCGRENELVTVELRVGCHNRQRVAAGIGEDVSVLLQVVADAHERGGVDVGRGPSVQVEVALVHRLRVGERGAVEVVVVLKPVTGGEGRRVDGGLLVTPVHVRAAGVDRQSEHAEQDQDQQRDEHDRLPALRGAAAVLVVFAYEHSHVVS